MKLFLRSKALLTVLFAGMLWSSINAQEIGAIEKVDCFLEDCSLLKDFANIEFGYVTVPEDYSKPEGRTFKVAFAIIKAVQEPMYEDPVIIFQGGWALD